MNAPSEVVAEPAPLGGGFGLAEIACGLLLGVAATISTPLQPLLLDALVRGHRLTTVTMGQAATMDMLGLALSSGAAGAFLAPRKLRVYAAVAAMGVIAANLSTCVAGTFGVLASRLASGGCSGILMWVTLGLLARSKSPVRMTGMFLAAQAAVGVVLAGLLAGEILPRFGFAGGYAALAGVGVVALFAATRIPRSYGALGRSKAVGLPPVAGLFALSPVFCFLAGLVSIWVYISPIALTAGRSASLVALAITTAISFKFVGGLLAVSAADKTNWRGVLPLGTAVCALIAAGLAAPTPGFVFLALIAGLGTCWMFLSAYHIPMLLEVDRTGRSALLVSMVSLMGGAAGPFTASLCVAWLGLAGAVWAAAAFLICSSMLLIVVWARTRPAVGAAAAVAPEIGERRRGANSLAAARLVRKAR